MMASIASTAPALSAAASVPSHAGRWQWVERFFPGHWPDLAAWERLEVFPKFFWKSREEQPGRWALGVRRWVSLDEVAEALREAPPQSRIYGGQAFHSPTVAQRKQTGAWADWPEAAYFLPEWELCPGASGTLVRWLVEAQEATAIGATRIEEVLTQKVARCLTPRSLTSARGGRAASAAIGRRDFPDYRGWAAQVHGVLAEFGRGFLEKVVLARASRLELSVAVPAFRLMQELAAQHPACAHFCFQPSRQAGAFLGASPERLFRRKGCEVETEAVAGTRARSLAPEEDARLENQLLHSVKERNEHAIVVRAVSAALEELCEPGWQHSEPNILKLARLQHLRSVFSGTLREETDDARLLRRLHPTPATGGAPGAAARDLLQRVEDFDRGWFAGPMGCFERDRSEVVVAIRSLRVWGGEAEVYAGAGIVEGSEPEREWAELDEKAAGALALFSV